MDWWLLSFFIGAIFSLFLPIVPEISNLLLFITLAAALFFYQPLRSSSGVFFAIAWLLFNGFVYNTVWQDNDLEPQNLAKQPHFVEGNIVNIPTKLKNVYRFNFEVTKLNDQVLPTSFFIRLRWEVDKENKDRSLFQGQTYRLKIKFKPAHGFANEGGFNYQLWLKQKNIVATGYVKNDKKNQLINANIGLRHQLYQSYRQNLPEHELSSLLLALSFAQRSEMSADIWQVLQATGTQHLIAISGLHLGLVASGSFIFFVLLVRILPLNKLLSKETQQKIVMLNLRYVVLLMSLAVTFFYGYLADFSLPTMRALLMIVLYWLMRLSSIKLPIKRWFLITIFLLILIEPFSLFSSSFWLSVYAVFIIFITLWRFSYVLSNSEKLWQTIKGLLIIQLSLTLFLLPLTALFYQQISLISLLANLIAVPVMSFIIIPLSLISLVLLPFSEFLSHEVMVLSLEVVQLLWWYLVLLAKQPFSLISISQIQGQFIAVFIGVVGVYCFLSPSLLPVTKLLRDLKSRLTKSLTHVFITSSENKPFKVPNITIIVFIAVLPMLSSITLSGDDSKKVLMNNHSAIPPRENKSQSWQVNVLDVGQGLAIIIQKDGHAILYDTGAAYPSGFNLVDAVIIPYLEFHGISKLDKVIISHSDNDHAGGLFSLQKQFIVDEFIINDQSIREPDNKYCLLGQSFTWQGLNFVQLWPRQNKGKANDDSCVIRISDDSHSVLLTGDISRKVERQLIANSQMSGHNNLQTISQLNGDKLSADILIAAHHGSKTSSSIGFIKKVAPETVIFSAGFMNRWQMPDKRVLQRFKEADIPTLSTNNQGMIRIEFFPKEIKIHTYRRDLMPYWFVN
ncbi:MAG: DNA internalization-related competence protein ComEC/Rec2 [Colwellia sp.]|nr:DNA internalization-related competence protein ComEC/Rec2 [Colwellia sp.]